MSYRIQERRTGSVTAVLGPTNTGKTHLAVERMLGHGKGTIGLPLRLLAREVYDHVVRLRGPNAAALITGEERIVPASPAYTVCTVESMSLDRPTPFVAVDEIQLAADEERGHIFTDRLLRARGSEETLLLGSRSMKPHLQRFIPDTHFVSRPRFSSLSYAGSCKLRRLPPRTAIIAFSSSEVYGLAELIRRERGGAAVVLGALSPRSRNAQVAMFETGEVDYIVATDAIGMGLNLDLNHVAFAGTCKFDGQSTRYLTSAELAQIAGRAGRHTTDGTFGVTGNVPSFSPELVERIENHRFEPLKTLYFRNTGLDYSTVHSLLNTLKKPPSHPGLVRAREANDETALKILSGLPNIAMLAQSPSAIKLLWEVCRVPDFCKTMVETHVRLLARIYSHLMSTNGTIPTDWVSKQVARLDRTDGDIDTLAMRISHVRTWSYISNRRQWIDDSKYWQQRIRSIEDRLSDALHDRLTQRFVDQRTSALSKKIRTNSEPLVHIEVGGDVFIEDHKVGHFQGLRFHFKNDHTNRKERAFRNAASSVLSREIRLRAKMLSSASDSDLSMSCQGSILWKGASVAKLTRGVSPLSPFIRLQPNDVEDGQARENIQQHLADWLNRYLRITLAPLYDLNREYPLSPAARGLLFQIHQYLGSLPRNTAAPQIKSLDRTSRIALKKLGVKFGETSIYLPSMIKPPRIAARWMLWSLHSGSGLGIPPPEPGRVSVLTDNRISIDHYEASGFRVCGQRAIRIDMLERLAKELRRCIIAKKPCIDSRLLSLVGCRRTEFDEILRNLGYHYTGCGLLSFARTPQRPTVSTKQLQTSPFAVLAKRLPDKLVTK